jgi:hypothetical protein
MRKLEQTPAFLVEALASCVAPKSAVYCSAPITSGRRNLAWLRSIGKTFATVDDVSPEHRESHAQSVIAANCAHARTLVDKIRRQRGGIVIDPTSFPPVPGWRQSQWVEFWGAVIERYAAAVVFLDDWQFSNGCAEEFAIAISLGLPTFTESGDRLLPDVGVALIRAAVSEMRELEASTAALEQTIARIGERDATALGLLSR